MLNQNKILEQNLQLIVNVKFTQYNLYKYMPYLLKNIAKIQSFDKNVAIILIFLFSINIKISKYLLVLLVIL